MRKVEIIKALAEKIKFNEGMTPEEFVRCLEKIGVVYNKNYVKPIRGYMYDLASKKYLEDIYDLVVEAEPYKNMKGNEVCLSYTINVFYCKEHNVFVYDHEDYDFEEVKVYCRKAPEWIKRGWEGMQKNSLTKDEFMEKIDGYIKENIQSKNVAA